MREFDELDEKKKRSALRWLTVVWALAVIFLLLIRFTVDMSGTRKDVDSRELILFITFATVIYIAAALLAAYLWRFTRWILLVAAAIACGLLIPFSFLMTVYAGWAYNLWQYVVLIVGTYAMYRVARTCAR
jgi:hypothetical protein